MGKDAVRNERWVSVRGQLECIMGKDAVRIERWVTGKVMLKVIMACFAHNKVMLRM